VVDANEVTHLLSGPLGGVVALWCFSALVHTLPEPTATSSPFYLWVYRVTQWVAANFTLIFGRALPPVTTVTTTETVAKQAHPAATVTTTVETTQVSSKQ
jgi:hypothetical protein